MSDFDFLQYLENSLESIEGEQNFISEDLENFKMYCRDLLSNSTIQIDEQNRLFYLFGDLDFEELESHLPRLYQSQIDPVHERGRFNQTYYTKKYKI